MCSGDHPISDETADNAASERLRIPCEPLSLSEASRRIIGYETSEDGFLVAKPNLSMEVWPTDWDCDAIDKPVRVYSVEGHETKIVVPETFAAQLDLVRRARLGTGDDPEPIAAWDPSLRYRALPEDFIMALDSLLSSRPIERLYLVNELHWLDPWVVKFSGPLESWAATCKHNTVTFYRKDLDPYLGDELRHEWAHLLCDEHPHDRVWFDLAVEREGKTYAPRDRALVDEAERHAVLMGEEMLSPDPARFLELTRRAPLQSVLLSNELRDYAEYLSHLRGSAERPAAKAIMTRVAYVEATILPRVLERLVADIRDSAEGSSRTQAERILLGLGKGHILNELPNVTSLDFSGLPIGARSLSWMKENSRIEHLNLARTFVGSHAGVEYLHNLPLRTLSVTNMRSSDLHTLEAIRTLEDLELGWIDNDRVMTLRRVCRKMNLRRLVFSGAHSPEAIAWLRKEMPGTEIVVKS